MTNPWLFILAVLTVLATPGPTNTLLATGGAVKGIRAALPLLFAELAGYLITVDVVGWLLRPLLTSEPAIGTVLKAVVAIYLVVTAARLWRSAKRVNSGGGAVGWRQLFIATLLNPKGLVFALAIIPFGQHEIELYLLAFAAAVIVMGFAWLVGGHLVGVAAGSKRYWVPRASSVVLVGFAGLIAASAFG
jgi:threonine/homoserine/homoserine lactone efflux protein